MQHSVRQLATPRPMQPDASHPAVLGRENFRLGRGASDQTPEMCRCETGEQCVGAAGLYSCEVSRLEARGVVANAVDPSMNGQQEALPYAVLDLSGREAGIEELGAGHDAMRPARKLADHLLRGGCPDFGLYMHPKSGQPLGSPPSLPVFVPTHPSTTGVRPDGASRHT